MLPSLRSLKHQITHVQTRFWHTKYGCNDLVRIGQLPTFRNAANIECGHLGLSQLIACSQLYNGVNMQLPALVRLVTNGMGLSGIVSDHSIGSRAQCRNHGHMTGADCSISSDFNRAHAPRCCGRTPDSGGLATSVAAEARAPSSWGCRCTPYRLELPHGSEPRHRYGRP